MARLRTSQGLMAKNDPSTVASLTIDGTRRDEFFDAIDRGLHLWMENEEKRTPKADRYAALCAASRQALERATDLIRVFARDRPNPKLVGVRVTSALLRHVPHGKLRPAQVFYRWACRIGEGVDPARGTVEINGTTFLVRPILAGTPYSRERIIRVEVSELTRSGRARVIDHPVDEVVDINHPRRPNDPARLATTATEVVRLAEARDGRLARILRTVFEEFEVTIKNLLQRVRRRSKEAPSRLILVGEHGIETVVFARVAGGGTVAAAGPDDTEMRSEELTQADIAGRLLQDLIDGPAEAMARHEQNIYDILDSIPTNATTRELVNQYVKLRDAAATALQEAATELSAMGLIDGGWLEREIEGAISRAKARCQDLDASLELSRRYLHAQPNTVSITTARTQSMDGPWRSGAHERLDLVAREIGEALQRFYQLDEAYWRLFETLATMRDALALYDTQEQ